MRIDTSGFQHQNMGVEMLRLFLPKFLLFFLASGLFAQSFHSIQFGGGLVLPRASSKGLSAQVQYNYSLNETYNFYIYSGYFTWDKYNITFIGKSAPYGTEKLFYSHGSDNHVLIPVYFGTRINFNTIKSFTTFIELEAGYSYLSYTAYGHIKETDPETGYTLSYYADQSSAQNTVKNLFGVGFGLGVFHPIAQTVNVVLSYKLNSNFNASESGFFSAFGTYSTLFFGLGINI